MRHPCDSPGAERLYVRDERSEVTPDSGSVRAVPRAVSLEACLIPGWMVEDWMAAAVVMDDHGLDVHCERASQLQRAVCTWMASLPDTRVPVLCGDIEAIDFDQAEQVLHVLCKVVLPSSRDRSRETIQIGR